MKKLVLMVMAACALAIPASAMAGRADSTDTFVCVDTTNTVVFSATFDENAEQGQQVVLLAEATAAFKLSLTCSIIE